MWGKLKTPLWKTHKENNLVLLVLLLIHGKSGIGILISTSLEPLFCPLYQAGSENLSSFMFACYMELTSSEGLRTYLFLRIQPFVLIFLA